MIFIYYSCNNFRASSLNLVREFLNRISPDMSNTIREISISYYSGNLPSKKLAERAFETLAQCGGLCKIHFRIDGHLSLSRPNVKGAAGYVPLLKRPGIRSLLKVRGIRELDVEIRNQEYEYGFELSNEVYERDKESFMEALQILKEPRGQLLDHQEWCTEDELEEKKEKATRKRKKRNRLRKKNQASRVPKVEEITSDGKDFDDTGKGERI